MRIGELSRAASTPVETIRYYEREGLLEAPARSAGNFRLYEPAHLERLQFIRYCRGLDMSLQEVRLLLRFRDAPEEDCGDVDALLDEHLEHVSQRIRQLRTLQRLLRQLRGRCGRHGKAAHCVILRGLTRAAQDAPAAPKQAASHVRG